MHSYVISNVHTQKSTVLILVLMEDALVLWEKHSIFYQRIVLILVLMEDALVHTRTSTQAGSVRVLILVLMEDALVRGLLDCKEGPWTPGLNPCFNGRCTRTRPQCGFAIGQIWVLILVLMEDALVRSEDNMPQAMKLVLILVLMEDALVQDPNYTTKLLFVTS